MHVLFVCNCEGKSLGRTRALLDRYATRIGDRAWITPITAEALDEVHRALRRKASRHTSVSCYQNDFARSMRLVWHVGNDHRHDPEGRFAMETRTTPLALPLYLQHAALLAHAAGLAHDLGKATRRFQWKLLETKPHMDAVRHEWISDFLLRDMLDKEQMNPDRLEQLLCGLEDTKGDLFRLPHVRAISHWRDALSFCVVSHHRLYGRFRDREKTASGAHVCRDKAGADQHLFEPHHDASHSVVKASFESAGILTQLEESIARLSQITGPAEYWHPVAMLARACLVLADHWVSAEAHETPAPNHDSLYANSHRNKNAKSGNKSKKAIFARLNQPLTWHLQSVSERAARTVRLLHGQGWPALEQRDLERILQPSSDEHYGWQDQAASFLKTLQESECTPTLVLNIASTGAGKTRANVKLLAALRHTEGQLRISAAFNLRSLTLQTRDAYEKQVGISKDQMICVIGEPAIVKLHEQQWVQDDEEGWEDNRAQSSEEPDTEVLGELRKPLPEDLQSLLASINEREHKLLATPVAVTTMDQLVAAGEPGRQGHHGKALIRVATSDLIVDEADSYDPVALMAVLRVVEMSAVCGRHVVVSTATLPEVLVGAITKVWRRGMLQRQEMENRTQLVGRIVAVSDGNEPNILSPGMELEQYQSFAIRQSLAAAARVTKKFEVAEISEPNEDAWLGVIRGQLLCLHDQHHTVTDDQLGNQMRISIGLIRVAHIETCHQVAKFISEFGEASVSTRAIFVATYHARELLVRRAIKEQHLDKMLNRKPSSTATGWWTHSSETKARVENAANNGAEDVIFIVVATPVEEVGRDHDFDWAVIEPSSLTSIIQTAGRVNRHRRSPIDAANIAVMDQPYCAFSKPENQYCKPGYRVSSTHQDEYGAILSTSRLLGVVPGETLALDTRLAFGDGKQTSCPFAKNDAQGINEMIEHFFTDNVATKPDPRLTQTFYQSFQLRQEEASQRFFVSNDHSTGMRLIEFIKHISTKDISVKKIPVEWNDDSPNNTFLSPTLKDCEEMIEKTGISGEAAMSFSLPERRGQMMQKLIISWLGAVDTSE